MSGYLGHLSPLQEQALKQLRETFEGQLNPLQDDHMLLQFLRARRFDLKKTEEMLKRHLQFRKEFPEEYMVNEYKPPKILMEHLLPPLMGYDKDGCPVRVVHIGHQDIKGLLCCFRRPELRKCITWFLDRDKADMRRRSRETGIHIESRTFIFDMDGLSFRQIYRRDVYELAISFLRLYEGNYPENLKVAYLINTPTFFHYLLNVIKSMLTDDTIQKIKMFGTSGWKDELLSCIDEDVLPVVYGGTRTENGDPNCPSLVRVYNPISKDLYLKNQNRLDADSDEVKRAVVARRSKVCIPVRVEVPGSTLVWEVECTNCDIRVYLLFEGEGVGETITIKSEFGSERGCHLATHAGKYSLVLDNSYSLLRSKQVLYKVFVSTCTAENAPSPPEYSGGKVTCL